MKPENVRAIVDIHPKWFLGLWPWLNRGVPEDFLTVGVLHQFCVGDGWYPLIQNLVESLHTLSLNSEMKDFKVVQIKEKFGGLRFYVSNAPPEAEKLIDAAETASIETCEYCGKPATITNSRGSHWLKCICNDCNKGETKNEV